MLGYFSPVCCCLLTFLNLTFSKYYFRNTIRDRCQTVWIQIKTDITMTSQTILQPAYSWLTAVVGLTFYGNIRLRFNWKSMADFLWSSMESLRLNFYGKSKANPLSMESQQQNPELGRCSMENLRLAIYENLRLTFYGRSKADFLVKNLRLTFYENLLLTFYGKSKTDFLCKILGKALGKTERTGKFGYISLILKKSFLHCYIYG